MNILSLHNAEDASICLVRDGKLAWALGEERINRKKLYKGFPEQALDLVLSREGLTLEDIDFFTFGWNAHRHDTPTYVKRFLERLTGKNAIAAEAMSMVRDRYDVEFERDTPLREAFGEWMATKGVSASKIVYYDHHLSHAWSAFATSPFETATIFTLDARGDMKSGSVSVADRDTGVSERFFNMPFDSIGFLYGQITHYLGYSPHRHEGKVTGLAAHGDAAKTIEIFRRLIMFDKGGFKASLGFYRPFFTNLSEALTETLSAHSREDIAAGLQVHCEHIVTDFIRYWLEMLHPGEQRNVCLSGGVFANVLINQRVAELEQVENVYISPHMGDGGLVLGAAAHKLFEETGDCRLDMPTVYLGTDYRNEEILTVLEAHAARGEIDYEDCGDAKVSRVVDDILADRVVGYFDGRMEWGPRALGARSILYHARDDTVNDWLNRRLDRTEFMPFAPVTPVGLASDAYIGWKPEHKAAELMTRTYNCTGAFIEGHPAAVHIDGTARPQIVTPALHGDYFAVVERYCAQSGDMALINTSFNHHEEPIVCSPQDAVRSLLTDNVDVLYVGRFRVEPRRHGDARTAFNGGG